MGLGSLGARMCRRVSAAGFPVVLYARRPETLVPLSDLQADVASDVLDLASRCDVVSVVVPDDDAVVALARDGLIDALADGATVVIHTTGSPRLSEELHARAATKGASLVDAPVSTARGRRGGNDAPDQGPIASVFVGGDGPAVAKCLPIFETWADPALHMGPVGSGQAAKLLNNLLYAAQLVLARAALARGNALGLEPAVLARAVGASSGASWAMVNFERGLALSPPELRMERIVSELESQLSLFKELAGLAELAGRHGSDPLGSLLDAAQLISGTDWT
ncbi:MAG: NAD(P)-dependent oxidoreductase, partial [Acidimicrobiales bacterium]|nr:NAD(P)-dependent oxidoreductase [Acidimicrobiales bacterium]